MANKKAIAIDVIIVFAISIALAAIILYLANSLAKSNNSAITSIDENVKTKIENLKTLK